MRIRLLIASAAALGLVGATSPAIGQSGVCTPSAPPAHPTNSEDFNPGFGKATGLNDDFHDDFEDPLDRPGAVISDISRDLAQDGEPGGVHVLQDFVGLDCPKG